MSDDVHPPERPHVPVVLHAMLAVVCVESLVLGRWVGWMPPFLLGAVALLCAVVALAHQSLRHGPARLLVLPMVLGLSCAVASLLAGLALAQLEAKVDRLSEIPVSSLSVLVVSDARESSGGWFASGVVEDGEGLAARVWLTLPERVSYGMRLSCVGRFLPNGDDDWGRSSSERGYGGRIKAARILGRSWEGGVTGVLASFRDGLCAWLDAEGSDASALVTASLTANTSSLASRGVDDDFAKTGLSHLVAVSGGHLVIVGACLGTILGGMGLGARSRAVLVIVASGAYVLLCASPSSAVRSWGMLGASLAGPWTSRRASSAAGVGLVGLFMCLVDPFSACDLGLRLSVLSVCGLCLFGDYATWLVQGFVGGGWWVRRAAWVASRLGVPGRLLLPGGRLFCAAETLLTTFAVSLVCQVATTPLCAVAFSRISLVAPLANVLVGPVFTPIVGAGLLACALCWVPLLGELLLGVVYLLAGLALVSARALASLPFSSVPIEAPPWVVLLPLCLGAVLLAAWPCPSPRVSRIAFFGAASALACLFGVVTFGYPASVTVLDVGQGDAILVRRGPHALLVDTGPGKAALAALARRSTYWLDAIVLSHLHVDHAGGLDELVDGMPVDQLYVGEGTSGALGELAATEHGSAFLDAIAVSELRLGDVVSIAGFTLECVWPRGAADASADEGDGNEGSLCLLLTYEGPEGTLRMLLTGDAESEELAGFVDEVGDIDVLKVGHHGSAASIDASQAAALSPEVSVASAGEGNSYGHPRPDCIETLKAAGSMFLCTKDVGSVTLLPGRDGVGVRTERSGPDALR